jgi:hypothetical protein
MTDVGFPLVYGANQKVKVVAMFELSNRDYGLMLLDHIDLDAQLLAIRSLLQQNRRGDEALTEEIMALGARIERARGNHAMQLVDDWVNELHCSTYRDAANSMAAVGMLAPLAESLLTVLFRNIGARHAIDLAGALYKQRTPTSDAAYWDPHIEFTPNNKRRDLVAGTLQLSAACGLQPYLPTNFGALFKALFTYRNNMFHNGFEWPAGKRSGFDRLIRTEGWPADWFDCARIGGEPWIYYMSDTLIESCLELIGQVIEGAGAFVCDLKARRKAPAT